MAESKFNLRMPNAYSEWMSVHVNNNDGYLGRLILVLFSLQ